MIDFYKLLKNSIGDRFYSITYGYCTYSGLLEGIEYPFMFEINEDVIFTDSQGRLSKNGECIIFPSENEREWREFFPDLKVFGIYENEDSEKVEIVYYNEKLPYPFLGVVNKSDVYWFNNKGFNPNTSKIKL